MQQKEQNISPIKQRILHFVDTLGISKREFYLKIGVSRGTLESKTGITEDVMAKFIAIYPEVDSDWLLLGRGSMIRGEEKEPIAPKVEVIEHPINVEMIGMLNEKSKEIGRLEAKVEMMENRIKELEAKLTASHTLPVAAEPHQGYEGKVNVSVIGLRAPVGGGTKKR